MMHMGLICCAGVASRVAAGVGWTADRAVARPVILKPVCRARPGTGRRTAEACMSARGDPAVLPVCLCLLHHKLFCFCFFKFGFFSTPIYYLVL